MKASSKVLGYWRRVPSRIQTDSAKVFVKNPSKNNFQWNKRYLHFCGHYGFEPSRSLPAHPWSQCCQLKHNLSFRNVPTRNLLQWEIPDKPVPQCFYAGSIPRKIHGTGENDIL